MQMVVVKVETTMVVRSRVLELVETEVLVVELGVVDIVPLGDQEILLL
jgi:hypothetical protein